MSFIILFVSFLSSNKIIFILVKKSYIILFLSLFDLKLSSVAQNILS